MSPFSNMRMSPLLVVAEVALHGKGAFGDERFGALAFQRDAGLVEGAFAAGRGR